jgi:hypothetical protein
MFRTGNPNFANSPTSARHVQNKEYNAQRNDGKSRNLDAMGGLDRGEQ